MPPVHHLQGIQRFYCVLSSQDWAEPFVVESGGCKIPVSLASVAVRALWVAVDALLLSCFLPLELCWPACSIFWHAVSPPRLATPTPQGAIAASVFKAFDGAEDRPAAALLVSRVCCRIVVLCSTIASAPSVLVHSLRTPLARCTPHALTSGIRFATRLLAVTPARSLRLPATMTWSRCGRAQPQG